MKKPKINQRARSTRRNSLPQCPFRITLELFCPVPGCLWNKTLTKNGEADGPALPKFREVFLGHWKEAHLGDWSLIKEVDLSTSGLERLRVKRELDRLTEGGEDVS